MKRANNGAPDSKGAAVKQPDKKNSLSRWRRRARSAALFLTVAILLTSFSLIHFYRSGKVDRLLAEQLAGTLAPYGIRAEIGRVETELAPQRVRVSNLALYHAQTGAKLAEVGRLTAAVRVEDLFALSLSRNIILESLELERPEVWLAFDEQGRANFGGLKLPFAQPQLKLPGQPAVQTPALILSNPAPQPKQTPAPTPAPKHVLFSYGGARLALSGGVLHFSDERRKLAGEAQQVRATFRPERAGGARYAVELACFNSSFSAAGRTVNDLSLTLAGQINSARAVISELRVKAPLAAVRASGQVSNWREPAYELQTESTIELSPLLELFGKAARQPGTASLTAAVKGQGTNYRVTGKFQADALSVADLRAETINVNAVLSGQGARYQVQGEAAAGLLAAGDWRLQQLQLAGAVTGAGTAWRWLGDLQAAAVMGGGQTSVTDVQLRAVAAEAQGGVISGVAARATAASLMLPQARIEQPQASGVEFNYAQTLSVKQARATLVALPAVQFKDVLVSGVTAAKRAGATRLEMGGLRFGSVQAEAARASRVNVAGARLVLRDGGLSGTTGIITTALVTLKNGRISRVRLTQPSFALETQGRYRADAALSLSGGLFNKLELGQVRGQLAANNEEVRLRNFTARIFNGTATGDALLSATPPAPPAETRWTLAGGSLEKAFRAVTRRGAQMSLHLQLAWRFAWR